MYDDILGPINEEIEIEINIKPKKKKHRAPKVGLNKAASIQSAPTVAKNVVGQDEEDEYCPECGCEVEECECEETALVDDEDDCDGCDAEGCDAARDDWDAGGEIEKSEDISSVKFFKFQVEDPCDGSKCRECNEKEDCSYAVL